VKFFRLSPMTILVWIAGVLLAIAIGFSGAYLNLGGRPGNPAESGSGKR
jgi:hypothetical protein